MVHCFSTTINIMAAGCIDSRCRARVMLIFESIVHIVGSDGLANDVAWGELGLGELLTETRESPAMIDGFNFSR